MGSAGWYMTVRVTAAAAFSLREVDKGESEAMMSVEGLMVLISGRVIPRSSIIDLENKGISKVNTQSCTRAVVDKS